MIHRGRIISGPGGPAPWVWRKYDGPNGHFKHLHVSVSTKGEDDVRPWAMPGSGGKVSQASGGDAVYGVGAKGGRAREIEIRLFLLGYDPGEAEGVFDVSTQAALEAFQKDHGLQVDGLAGRLSGVDAVNAGAKAVHVQFSQ